MNMLRQQAIGASPVRPGRTAVAVFIGGLPRITLLDATLAIADATHDFTGAVTVVALT
jgi:hypothetical protein